MTQEQKQAIKRCKDMLKRAFPDLTGYVKFDIGGKPKVVACHIHQEVKE
jgi:hypothetical protein